MKRPRIAMVSLSPLAVGGIETHLLQIFRELREHFEFLAIGTLAEPFQTDAEALGVDCIPVPAAGKADWSAIIRLRDELRARHVDIVHTHETRAGLLGRLAARWASCRIVHTVHTPSFFLPAAGWTVAAYKGAEACLNRFFSDRVIFVSQTILQLYIRERLVSPPKAFWIPNGLEPEWLAEAPVRSPVRSAVTFLYIGRLSREKGLDLLAQAFGQAAGQHQGIRLRIIGAGPEADTILRLARAGGWEARLEMPGRMTRREARAALQQADVFVLPSRFESMSYTLLEAMACGLPCIATDVGGNADLVESERTGLLVPPRNPAALAAAMLRLAGSPLEREAFGAAGWQKAQRYTLKAMITSTDQLYRELCRP
jgi:glycosyltransferase involved in cell wall biosynthesis